MAERDFENVLQPRDDDLEAMPESMGPKRRRYAAMVKALDDGVGRVLDALEAAGLEEETWVLFVSDNGGDPRYGGSNRPLRGEKATLWEGGIHVPAIMRWPGKIPSGAVSDQPASTLDLFPTIAVLLGISTDGLRLDGMDVRGVLFEGERIDRELFWDARGYRALRRGRWKYLQHETGPPMLFDLEADPQERHDLAEQYPEHLEKLTQAFLARRDALTARM